MKLTVLVLIVLFTVFAFAGVEPMTSYKDSAWNYFDSVISNLSETDVQQETLSTTTNTTSSQTTPTPSTGDIANTTILPVTTSTPITSVIPTLTTIAQPTSIPTATLTTSITGAYKNYYLGLVKSPEGVINGSNCYGEFIVLINNKEAKNPTYSELLDFLRSDKTDDFPYQYTISIGGFYFGEAEDKIDLDRIWDIIDGKIQPDLPRICADFAERLHNNAEIAGIRAGYVSLDMIGYSDPASLGLPSVSGHACNIFETTDRGLVYIDDTGFIGSIGPTYKDTTVEIEIGKEYNPDFLFPSGGWYIPDGEMGVVTDLYITWDGNWN